MTTKKCAKCGWEYPIDHNEARCRFCGTFFKTRICSVCGELKDTYAHATCKDCYNAKYRERGYGRRAIDNERARAVRDYEKWVAMLKATPQHSLTEKEWLAACKHFKACALCPTESIDARGYVVPYQDGGRYTACNILPMCELCATELKVQPNPFLRLNKTFNDKWRYIRPLEMAKFYKALEYLKRKMGESNNDE